MWKKLLKAAKFAKKAHGAQVRAHGTPYYKHPMAVARILWDRSHRNEALIVAAYLHDVVEDTPYTIDYIFDTFGLEVASLVSAMTKVKAETHEGYFRRIKAAGADAVRLKMADREHNNSELCNLPPDKDYIRVKAEKKTALMLKVFSGKD